MKLETYIEIPVTVEFEVDPGQKLIMYPNDRAQPGIDPSIEDMTVSFGGYYLQLDDLGIEIEESLDAQCWDYLRGLEE